ncbi:hypothetical protein LH51_01295 [Nitrincola sp. A-D6]|nr:hypothetical protein LH51_01295 [Nitrincola sp. A-D6]
MDCLVKCEEQDTKKVMSSVYSITLLLIPFLMIFYYLTFNAGWLSLGLLILSVFFYVNTRVNYFIDVRSKKFARASMWLALFNVFTIIFQILLSVKYNGLILGLFLSLLTVSLIQLIVFRKSALIEFDSIFDIKNTINTIKNYKSYTLYLTLYSLVSSLRSKTIYIFLGGSPYAGALSQFEKVANAPNTLVSSVLRPVIFSSIDKKEINRSVEYILGGLLSVLFMLGLPFLMILLKYSEYIVGIVFGEKWIEYDSLFAVCMVSTFVMLLINWMDRVFDILGKQKIVFIFELIFLSIYIAGFVIVSMLEESRNVAYLYLLLNIFFAFSWLLLVYHQAQLGYKNLIRRMSYLVSYLIIMYLYLSVIDGLNSIILISVIYLFTTVVLAIYISSKMRCWLWIKSRL